MECPFCRSTDIEKFTCWCSIMKKTPHGPRRASVHPRTSYKCLRCGHWGTVRRLEGFPTWDREIYLVNDRCRDDDARGGCITIAALSVTVFVCGVISEHAGAITWGALGVFFSLVGLGLTAKRRPSSQGLLPRPRRDPTEDTEQYMTPRKAMYSSKIDRSAPEVGCDGQNPHGDARTFASGVTLPMMTLVALCALLSALVIWFFM